MPNADSFDHLMELGVLRFFHIEVPPSVVTYSSAMHAWTKAGPGHATENTAKALVSQWLIKQQNLGKGDSSMKISVATTTTAVKSCKYT